MGILGFYFSLYMVSGLFSGKKKAVAAPSASSGSAEVSADAMPAFDSPNFDKWISTPGNLEKYMQS